MRVAFHLIELEDFDELENSEVYYESLEYLLFFAVMKWWLKFSRKET